MKITCLIACMRICVWVRPRRRETKKLTSRNSNLCLYYYYSMLDMCILNKLMQLTEILRCVQKRLLLLAFRLSFMFRPAPSEKNIKNITHYAVVLNKQSLSFKE